jgi:NADH-quinone oxidoreductase subunit I
MKDMSAAGPSQGANSTPSGGSAAAPAASVGAHIRRAYWNAQEMGWWERSYLPEIVRGLSITGGVFMRNMWRWMTLRKGALTTYYPEETRADFAPRNRGKHVLTQRPDGRPQCVACNLCATVCPAKVIEIEAGFDPSDAAHPKYPVRFEIDYSRCIFCGLCVEACPEDAIRMVKEVPSFPSGDRTSMWLSLPELLQWNPQSDVAKPYPPKGRG